jgi:hypothetical protein
VIAGADHGLTDAAPKRKRWLRRRWDVLGSIVRRRAGLE